ncbi:hypothetical protein SELMODRAFT_411374 [Selaginella moellendorffii]|uniref:Exonuclease domain-containing protein n=1 Tax=Selaginella moellendorffii TaxID=88036 RepID=D8RHF6_SELML|nr:hypothetical protein SELMODRAFT_411374 [Selaginella moellendorffii]
MPEAAGFIDTLPLLQRTFGQRARNLKLSTLAAYFSLGKQEHRSLPDVRMNIKVLKRCATVLLLESNFPHLFQSSPQAPQKRRRSSYGGGDDFRLVTLSLEEAMLQLEGGECEAIDPKMQNEEQEVKRKLKFETGEDHNRFLQPHEVLLDSVGAVYDGGPSVIPFHGSNRLCVQADNSKVKFSVSDRYAFSETGMPTFKIVIIPSAELLAIVKHCEAAVKNKCALFGINAKWQPALFVTKDGHEAIRIRIGTNGEGSSATYTTKLYRNLQEVSLGSVDPKSFREIVPADYIVDAAIQFDAYAFERGSAGLKLLAEKLNLH